MEKNMVIGKQQWESHKSGDLELIICLPGERLCVSNNFRVGGKGTYQRQGYICATLAGRVIITEKDKMQLIEVVTAGKQSMIPSDGDIVTAQVMQVTQRFAKCSIIGIGDHILNRRYKAVLRKECVRATEKDHVEMYKCFRPNDIILARILPQSEMTYQLTTAENNLGVVIAYASEISPLGSSMVPISWTEMQCPDTFVKEPRKVAKVVPESTSSQFSITENFKK